MIKNGGFPPIKYCLNTKRDQLTNASKERFFANAPKQNINIRQLFSETKKKPIIIIDEKQEALEVIDSI
jgi:hypothetical protein